jgi:hypothetical protein
LIYKKNNFKMKNLMNFKSWRAVVESAGISRAIYSHLAKFFDTHGEEGSYEDAKKYVASKVEGWDLSKEDFEEAKKECC